MKVSAGILMFRKRKKKIQFLLVHPGGPYFIKKQEGVWSIPKGEFLAGEEPLAAAIREFEEETGHRPSGDFIELNPITQKGGKKVLCWAVEDDLNHENIVSNTFEIEWPLRSGKMKSFPEIDKAGWFDVNDAMQLINEKQIPLLEELISKLKSKR
jgi:predicted NUDIX family NTP pyrophosphohydrolase